MSRTSELALQLVSESAVKEYIRAEPISWYDRTYYRNKKYTLSEHKGLNSSWNKLYKKTSKSFYANYLPHDNESNPGAPYKHGKVRVAWFSNCGCQSKAEHFQTMFTPGDPIVKYRNRHQWRKYCKKCDQQVDYSYSIISRDGSDSPFWQLAEYCGIY